MLGSGLVRTMFGITDVTRSRHVGPLPLLTADGFTHLKSEEVYFLTLSRDAREEDKVELIRIPVNVPLWSLTAFTLSVHCLNIGAASGSAHFWVRQLSHKQAASQAGFSPCQSYSGDLFLSTQGGGGNRMRLYNLQ